MIDDHIIDFIQDHLTGDPDLLVLQKDKYPGIPLGFVATQVSIRQKLKGKFPFLQSQTRFLFPSKLSYEQSSSEATAAYKVSFFSGKQMADLTGGLGIDSYFFSKNFSEVNYVERDGQIAEYAVHNFQILESPQIRVHNQAAEEFLDLPGHYDLIYLDPARRDLQSRKVFRIEDCEPNLLELNEKLLEKAGQVLWKASPLLDIKSVLRQIIGIYRVDVVSVGNEVKELLFHMSSGQHKAPVINCVDLHNESSFEFTFEEEENEESEFSVPLQYIYEPASSILKAGAFRSIGKKFGLYKLAVNSHLYTSEQKLNDFPGRTFRVLDTLKPNAKEVRKAVPGLKANLSCRNFPMKVEDLKKKLRLKDGGDLYLFATQDVNRNKILILSEKTQDSPVL